MRLLRSLTALGLACVLAAAPARADEQDASGTGSKMKTATTTISGPYRVVRSGQWRLETSLFGIQPVRLIAPPTAGDDGAGGPVYVGSGLDAILHDHPSLVPNKDLEAIRRALDSTPQAYPDHSTWRVRLKDGPFTYETWRGAERAYLIQSHGEDLHLLQGADLAAILARHPALTDDTTRLQEMAKALQSLNLKGADSKDPGSAPAHHLFLEMSPGLVRAVVWTQADNGAWEAANFAGADYASMAATNPQLAKCAIVWFDRPDGAASADASEMRSAEITSIGLTLVEGPVADAEGSATHEIRVERVTPDGAAARLGLKPGDLLLEIDGAAVASLDEAASALKRTRTAQDAPLAVLVERDGKPMTLTLAKGEKTTGPGR